MQWTPTSRQFLSHAVSDFWMSNMEAFKIAFKIAGTAVLSPGLASWANSLGSHTRPCAQKGLHLA
jgi:hypothetical protein